MAPIRPKWHTFFLKITALAFEVQMILFGGFGALMIYHVKYGMTRTSS
jgi:hypothetical protein